MGWPEKGVKQIRCNLLLNSPRCWQKAVRTLVLWVITHSSPGTTLIHTGSDIFKVRVCLMISLFLQQFIWRLNHALPYGWVFSFVQNISWCFENELLFAWETWIKSADRSCSNLGSSNWIKERQFTIYRNCVYVYIIIMHNSIQQLCSISWYSPDTY